MTENIQISSSESFVLPPIWDDDDAMFSLMQPIKRPKHVDPDAYNKKIKFWTDLLIDYTKQQRIAVINMQSLKTVFGRYFIEEGIQLTPQCLPEVFSALIESGELEPIENRSNLLHTILKTSFDYLLKSPLDWTYRLVFGEVNTSERSVHANTARVEPNQHFALTDLSKQLVSQFMTYFNNKYETRRLTLRLPVYELSDFESALTEFLPHDATREYVKMLCTDVFQCVRLESVSDPEGSWKSQVVRVSSSAGCPLPRQSKTADSQAELSVIGGLAHLRAVIRQQEAEEQKLITEIEDRRKQIRALMKQNRIREAKNLLQRTKIFEKSLVQRQAHLNNLEAMQIQIDSASDNQTVLRALAGSGRALQQTTGGAEGLAKVEDTMLDISDAVHDSNEVSDLLSGFGRTNLIVDEDELEKELKDLLKPEPEETTKPQTVPKSPAEISAEQLEAELAALGLDQLRLPDVPETSNRTPEKSRNPLWS